jgi:hypothetical protein
LLKKRRWPDHITEELTRVLAGKESKIGNNCLGTLGTKVCNRLSLIQNLKTAKELDLVVGHRKN